MVTGGDREQAGGAEPLNPRLPAGAGSPPGAQMRPESSGPPSPRGDAGLGGRCSWSRLPRLRGGPVACGSVPAGSPSAGVELQNVASSPGVVGGPLPPSAVRGDSPSRRVAVTAHPHGRRRPRRAPGVGAAPCSDSRSAGQSCGRRTFGTRPVLGFLVCVSVAALSRAAPRPPGRPPSCRPHQVKRCQFLEI